MAKIAVFFAFFLAIFATEVDANMIEYMEYLKDILAHITESDPCGEDTIAYYKFDRSYRDVCFGHNAVKQGSMQLQQSSGIANGAMYSRSTYSSYLHVSSLNGHEWGSKFSVSIWFKTDYSEYSSSRTQGLINNGPVNKGGSSSGSWEIRISSHNEKFAIGASLVTSHSAKSWDNITTIISNHWHHLVMTYDGNTISFYLDNHLKLSDSESCHGDIIPRNTDVEIGRIKYKNMNRPCFNGWVDEVKLFKKALNFRDVTKLYQLKNV